MRPSESCAAYPSHPCLGLRVIPLRGHRTRPAHPEDHRRADGPPRPHPDSCLGPAAGKLGEMGDESSESSMPSRSVGDTGRRTGRRPVSVLYFLPLASAARDAGVAYAARERCRCCVCGAGADASAMVSIRGPRVGDGVSAGGRGRDLAMKDVTSRRRT